MRTVRATRYVTPLREGGSLPAVVEADDDGLYVLKFRGAGQGPGALVAELVAGEVARAMGLPVPEIVFVELDPVLGRSEPDFEIQNLVKNSGGLNIALDFLPGALVFDAAQALEVPAELASRIVWLDAFVANVDRTARNTNMMVWHRQLYLIDHGAAFYFQHNWATYQDNAESPFRMIKDHVLLQAASDLEDADTHAHGVLSADVMRGITDAIPDDWLGTQGQSESPQACRAAHLRFMERRLAASGIFVAEAHRARHAHV